MTEQESLYASLRTSVNRGLVTDAELQGYLTTFRPQAARPGANMEQADHVGDVNELVSEANSTNLSNSSPAAIWPREEE